MGSVVIYKDKAIIQIVNLMEDYLWYFYRAYT